MMFDIKQLKLNPLFITILLIIIVAVYFEKYNNFNPTPVTEKQAEAIKETCLKLGLRMKIYNTYKSNTAACYK